VLKHPYVVCSTNVLPPDTTILYESVKVNLFCTVSLGITVTYFVIQNDMVIIGLLQRTEILDDELKFCFLSENNG
jgi:hypothetical protein